MDLKNKILLLFLLLIPLFSFSQISNKRCKWVKYSQSEFVLDTLSAFPSSVKVASPNDPSITIEYDINKNTARINALNPPDSVLICYTVLPYHLSKPYYQRDVTLYDSNAYYRENAGIGLNRKVPLQTREEIFSSPGITKTGNISRGISFGNTQNVFVNSTLNLQMEGHLTQDIRLTAVISDQNIPFQPEGNTQQLQQFDKVYVQLETKKTRLTVGDVVMQNKPSNYLRYSRNVQGAYFEYNTHSADSTIYSTTSLGIAIAKGKFNTMFFAPGQPDSLLEGVQGPYKLKGPNGETFISVLSNSEKIYLDGKLLKRGFDYDYTIDYNQAEVTFTNNVLITRYARVRVDFEYTDKIYSRTIVNASYYQQYKKVNFYTGFYQEKDNPNNPLGVTLTKQDKALMNSIGDSIDLAYASGIDSLGFNHNQILYKKIYKKANALQDSLDSFGYPIVAYSTDSTQAIYQANFTQVEPGKGNYVIDASSTANGRVYKYAPDTTESLRIYEPISLVQTPKSKSMIVVGGGANITKTDKVYAEGALSHNDINLYSSKDKGNDNGISFKVGYVNGGKKISFSKYKFTSSLDYEYNQKTFTAIDRFRDPEFERNWSENVNVLADNHILNGSAGFRKDANNVLEYKIGRRIKGEDVNGYQQQATFNQKIKNFTLLTTGSLMNNNQSADKSNWKKFNGSISYPVKFITAGVAYNLDKNVVRNNSGSVIGSAMYYDEVRFNIRSTDSTKIKFTSDYSIRHDQHPLNGQMAAFTKAHTSSTNFMAKIGKHNTLKSNLTYRYLQYITTADSTRQNEETILGRTDFNSDFFKRVIRSQLTITTGTGRQAVRQYVFVPVQGGTGNYIWIDKDSNNVQELNEFVPINTSYNYANQTTYIKEYVPSNTYVKAYYNTFNYRVNITMPKTWGDKGGFKSFLSKFSNTSSWTIDKKITDPNLWHRFGPSLGHIDSNNVLSLQRSIKSALFFNRSNPVYGADLNYLVTDQKSFLTQGFQTQQNKEYKVNTRLNIKKHFNIKLSGLNGLKTNISNFLSANNYHVLTHEIFPEISYQPSRSLRLTWNFAYTYKQNVLKPELTREKVYSYQFGTEIKYNKVSKHTIDAVVKYIKIYSVNFYTPQSPEATSYSSAIAYEMLQALQNGNNITWTLTWMEKLVNGLQLSFSYEGRKTGTAKVVNIGRMQVSALF